MWNIFNREEKTTKTFEDLSQKFEERKFEHIEELKKNKQ